MTLFFFRKPRHRLGKRQHRLGKRRQRLHRHAVATLALILAMLMFFALCGCKSARATVEIPVLIHDTTVTVRHLHDSTYVDRWHTVYQKGDTVYDTKTITITKTVTKTDTVFRASEKPVTVTRCQIKEVERRLTAWQRFRLGAFWWLLLAVGLSLPVPLLRRKFASKNK